MSKPQKALRHNAYTVRYNDEENDLVEQASEDKSLETGSWIRMITVLAAREFAKVKKAKQDKKKAMKEKTT